MSFVSHISAAQWGRLVLVGALATGVLSATAGRGTLAYFSTQVKSDANTFTAGNLHFSIADNDETATAPSVASSMTLTNLKPGDVVYAPLTLANTGSVDAKWGIKYTTTAAASNLATALKLGIVARGSGSAATADCDSANWADDTAWSERVLATPEAMTNAGRTIVNATWTDAPTTDGEYTGAEAAASHYLPMKPGVDMAGAATNDPLANDVVCVQVSFPDTGAPGSLVTGDNQWNGAAPATYDTTIVFTFDGIQRELTRELDQN